MPGPDGQAEPGRRTIYRSRTVGWEEFRPSSFSSWSAPSRFADWRSPAHNLLFEPAKPLFLRMRPGTVTQAVNWARNPHIPGRTGRGRAQERFGDQARIKAALFKNLKLQHLQVAFNPSPFLYLQRMATQSAFDGSGVFNPGLPAHHTALHPAFQHQGALGKDFSLDVGPGGKNGVFFLSYLLTAFSITPWCGKEPLGGLACRLRELASPKSAREDRGDSRGL